MDSRTGLRSRAARANASAVHGSHAMRSRVTGVNVFNAQCSMLRASVSVEHSTLNIQHYNCLMLLLRFAAVLTLVVWIGGLLALGGVAAPAIFDVAAAQHVSDGRLHSGAIFGEI